MLSDLIILLFVAMYSLIPNYKLGKSISNEVLLNRLEEEFLKGFPNAGVLFSFKYNIYIAKYRKQTNVAQNKPSCNHPPRSKRGVVLLPAVSLGTPKQHPLFPKAAAILLPVLL